jgi:hypothetical protein
LRYKISEKLSIRQEISRQRETIGKPVFEAQRITELSLGDFSGAKVLEEVSQDDLKEPLRFSVGTPGKKGIIRFFSVPCAGIRLY